MNAYLCFPFSHKFKIVCLWRWYKSTLLTARIMKKNPDLCVFSPVTFSYPVSLFLNNALSHDFWLKQDFSHLDRWADIILIPIEEKSWVDSYGIRKETERFNGMVVNVANSGEVL